ncbi:ThiF family adenylyltransferase [Curtobacterium sp. MCBD17_035]|uniref:ThiF family adenylyltransferase n=1 Tax=Curtobacterium sp. MCBD17_035 TaxID=2175673 RepID=UPI000DA8CE22|nr:ThiF family adenylyltransferase [Curtobacterium sp. MCBD17_035]WIB67575.1 ThiF family adenylyltransferase [Curtobacterium sp. MCBD17_035]
MSTRLVGRSRDLQRLLSEGFEVRIEGGMLVVDHVPYVTAEKTVAYGALISELTTDGTATLRPSDHTMHFTGVPHDNDGRQLTKVVNTEEDQLYGTLRSRSYLSSKPQVGYYDDYYAKVTAYVRMISPWTTHIDPAATPNTFAPLARDAEDGVFAYFDSATSRAGTGDLNDRLLGPVAIIGTGGTGSYILDFVAKTPVAEIHLFDADDFLAHNAFRTPGAASIDDLATHPTKVDYLRDRYAAMRRGIHAHAEGLDHTNASAALAPMQFVFISMDAGPAKRDIINALEELGVPFVDCGMAVARQGNALGGIVRVTGSVPGERRHVRQWVTYSDTDEDEYGSNIQIAELNALNAAHAVIWWKKVSGYYVWPDHEMHTTYTLSGNLLTNDEATA